MRRYKRAKPNLKAWGFAILFPVVVLFVLFSLLPYDVMVGKWPFGIGQSEVMKYQRIFDRRPGQSVSAAIEQVRINGDGAKAAWSGAGYERTVDLAEQEDGSLRVGFPLDAPFQDQRALVLRQGDLVDLQVLYGRTVAEHLGLRVPRLDILRLERNGKDVGSWLGQEVWTAERNDLGAHARGRVMTAADAALVFRTVHADDTIWAAYALVQEALGRSDMPALVFDPSTGRMEPLFRPLELGAQCDTANAVHRQLSERLRAKATQDLVHVLAERLRSDSAVWAERFTALDSLWEPALADGRNIGLTSAGTKRQAASFMARLFHPDPIAFHGATIAGLPGASPAPTAVPDWMERYRTDKDTIRLVRGRYDVTADIRLPAGTALVLERGTRLFFAPGTRLVVEGALHMRGTELNPVFLRPAEEGGTYGGILVLGDGNTPCRIRGVRMSGGTGLEWDGVSYPGMIDLIGASSVVSDCSFEGPGGAAMLYLRDGTASLQRNNYVDHTGTAIFGDGAVIQVRGGQFLGGGKAKAGIQVEGGRLLVDGATITGYTETAVSADREAQVLLTTLRTAGPGVGFRAMGASVMHIDRCQIEQAKAIVAKASGLRAGGAKVVVSRSEGATALEVDAASSVTDAEGPDPAVWQSFGVRP